MTNNESKPTVFNPDIAVAVRHITIQDEINDQCVIKADVIDGAEITVGGLNLVDAVGRLATEVARMGAECEAWDWSREIGRTDPCGLADQLKQLESQALIGGEH